MQGIFYVTAASQEANKSNNLYVNIRKQQISLNIKSLYPKYTFILIRPLYSLSYTCDAFKLSARPFNAD
jgi:hypothetical protein